MKITFHGAARTVTGSKHLVETENGKRILLDCGLFQGMGGEADVLNRQWGFDPSSLDAVVLSHAHIDHIGLLPKLCKDGFRGPIWCTPATQSLVEILLLDSAEIQESDARFASRQRQKRGLPPEAPLYTLADAQAVLPRIRTLPYGASQTLFPGIELCYTDSGHILGSAAINLTITEKERTTRLTFSGDVGQYRDMILRQPEAFPQADVVLCESTYGDRLHAETQPTLEALRFHVAETCGRNKGKVIIPAFSVGRTQELLFQLNELYNKGQLPGVPVFVDSPLSAEATRVVKSHPECFNAEVARQLRSDNDVFGFPGLHFTQSVEESKAINVVEGPCIIISSSGMAEAGRIKHHIRNNIGREENKILLVGYADPHSLAGRLKNGARRVRIFGDEFEVRCDVQSLEGMSAHGDADDLVHWLSCQERKPVICLVHGEIERQQVFKEHLLSLGYPEVFIPALHEMIAF